MAASLPFTRDAFLDVFATYNTLLWPAAFALWLATVAVVVAYAIDARHHGRTIAGLLAIQWVWAGVAYHAIFFAPINPAAWAFAVLFLVEAVLLAWTGAVHTALEFSPSRSLRGVLSWTFIIYGLVYPALALADGDGYPRTPTFGVPCPTTILTVGFLLASRSSLPAWLIAIPIMWTVVGGSAAVLLGIRADLALPVAGICLGVAMFRTHSLRSLTS